MGKWYAIDFIAWMAILAWIGFSVFCAINGNPDLFQRSGGLGIVFGVMYNAIISPPVLHPVGQVEAQALRDKTVINLENAVNVANMNVSLLAASLRKAFENEGKSAPGTVVALAKVAEDNAIQGKSYPAPINRDKEIETAASGIAAADSHAARVERIRFITQATLVVVGTLQSSFGSLLVSAG